MADAVPEMTPYSTAKPLMGVAPQWLPALDSERILSYQVYEQMYWSVDSTFKLVQRGSQANPIYVPTGRTIVDTTNRFTGTGLEPVIDPVLGSPNDRAALLAAITALFRRERFKSKYNAAKRFGLIRGDWGFHIVADPNKAEGRRISIYALDPGSMFQITHPDDIERVTGWHLIDQWLNDDGDLFIKRQTYSKGPDPYDPDADDGKIWTSTAIYEVDEWWAEDATPVVREVEPHPLPDEITALPVYHIRNFEEPGNPWGSSEMRGFERLMASINQSMSDEELALALDGLGVYATTSGPPEDDNGNPTNWRLGPGRVLELEGLPEGTKIDEVFKRVNGVGSVTPYGDHIKRAYDFLMESADVPAIARGMVDVQVAESGVALAIQFSPMLAKTAEKDQVIEDVLVQMFYDLGAMWFPAFEGQGFGEAVAVPRFGEKLPTNREAAVKEILEIVGGGLASAEWGRMQLAKFGFVFDEDEGNNVVAEAAAKAAAADPYALRADQEMDGPPAGTDNAGEDA